MSWRVHSLRADRALRPVEADACTGKQRLDTWAEGERVIERLIAENIAAGRPFAPLGLVSYRCPYCPGYHVGHGPRMR